MKRLHQHPNACLFVTGALATLALPPVDILPLIFLSLGWLGYQIAEAQTVRQAFVRGGWWALGYFIFGLYWVSFALLINWPTFAWLLPFSILGLPILVSAYIALMAAALFWMASKFRNPKRAAILLFPIFWTAAELLRGHLFTGFPWNIIGTTLTDFTPLFLSASVIGVYGLGFVIAATVSLWLVAPMLPRVTWMLRGCAAAILIVMAAFGAWRMAGTQPPSKTLHVRIVQPNISEEGPHDFARRERILRTLLDLTRLPAAAAPDLIIWPEAAVPFILSEAPNVRTVIARALPPHAILATGSIRRDEKGQLYNSIEYLDSHGDILGHYDKSHLVPFGEYMPFARYLHIRAVAEFFGDMGRGDGPETQDIAGLRVSPLICYEAIFPGEVIADTSARPELLINVTDDAWYGKTAGPHQHLAEARARAVEEGIPIVRSANTGISAAADPFGRVINDLPFGVAGVIDVGVSLPADAHRPPGAGGKFYFYLAGLMAVYLMGAMALIKKSRAE